MTEDAAFNLNPDDLEHVSDERGVSLIEEERREVTKRIICVGIVLLISPLLIFVIPMLVPTGLTDQSFIWTMILAACLAVIGAFWMVYHGTSIYYQLLTGLEILKRIAPLEPILTSSYVLTRSNDVYILALPRRGFLFFVMFKESITAITRSKIGLPRVFWLWEPKTEIAGMKLYRREGTFSIPILSGEYVSGEGILYGIQYFPSQYHPVVPEFSREQLVSVIDHLSNECRTSSSLRMGLE
ncbi:MAG: hypothetical protein KAU89_06505 [Candidatus Thorarchaeota archaeon]|jgi:hypothetical protein|nr:hypothetical protein [Candidatus Thorarchaeota archaeon]